MVGGAKAEFSWREAPLLAGASQWPLCVPASTTSSAVKRESFSLQPDPVQQPAGRPAL